MLGIMRRYKQSVLIKIVFGIIVLSFVGTIFLVWGKGEKEGGPSGYAAKVDGTKISLEEFEKTYYRTRSIYEQLYGRSLSPEMEKQMGLKKLTLDNLIDNVLVRKAAKKMGLSVSKDEVAAEIEKVPAFQKNGAFDLATYQQTLKVSRMTPSAFEDAQEEEILVKKAREKVKSEGKVTDQDILQAFRKQNDKVNLQFASFSPADVKGGIKLTDQELTSYLQDHQAEFKTPEEVSLAFVRLSPAQLAEGVAVTPEEAQSYYQKNIDRYQGKGGILPFSEVKDQATADAKKQKAAKEAYEKAADAANKFRTNADIEAAATALGGKVEKTPLFTQQQPAAAIAGEKDLVLKSFQLKQGELGGPVETPKGIYLLKVVEKRPSVVPPLAQIKAQVEKKALEAKAAEVAKKKAEELLAQLPKAPPASLKETGSFGYQGSGQLPNLGTSPELMEEAFTLTAAAPAAKKVYKIGDRWYAVKLKARTEAPGEELNRQRETIRQALLPKKQQEALDAWIKGLRAKAKIEINKTVVAE